MSARVQPLLFSGHVELRDAIEGLSALEESSVDLVFSDLPAGVTRAPTDVAPDMSQLWPAVWRALKPQGVAIFMAASFAFAAEVHASGREWFRYDLVWEKSLATQFFDVRRRPLRAHEHLLVFYRDAGHYYDPQRTQGHAPSHRIRRRGPGGTNYSVRPGTDYPAGKTEREPRSVLRYSSVGQTSRDRVHHQQKPDALCRWVIASYCPPGGLVVDPYAGSGSAVHAAVALGRRGIGFDTDPQYGTASQEAS